jgi:hypothetical protein
MKTRKNESNFFKPSAPFFPFDGIDYPFEVQGINRIASDEKN